MFRRKENGEELGLRVLTFLKLGEEKRREKYSGLFSVF